MTHNHINYQARLNFVQKLLCKRFSLSKNADIVPIRYDPEFPFKYNNFVYRVSLPSPIDADQTAKDGALQPGCVAIPKGTTELIVRLTNSDAEGMHAATRVENEVATITLASAALRAFRPNVVPQLMAGTPVVDSLENNLDLGQKKQILLQMAQLLKALQEHQLPESITDFGGVTFDEAGTIASAAMPSVGAGPWPSYEASFRSRLEIALAKADGNPYIKGWRANGLREQGFLSSAFCQGSFPSSLPPRITTEAGKVEWEAAKAWENAPIEAGIADVDTVLCSILPWRVSNEDILRRQTEEVIMECKNDNEEHLDKLLRRLGF
ncbi:hypothetical protein QBC46DRAFT_460167 [Diplogelasinospora grovesii]|uniref:Aminoglycoside phosphotransferase domain-containing protein n=1 Tax=Diplogelasinospora grovesii TaxID=303347 RepID=A0AAN6N4R1_9PEZI|nr:hypothetical protein QBC46DRAFT_460167 [Diplogelasinospora grovesii]